MDVTLSPLNALRGLRVLLHVLHVHGCDAPKGPKRSLAACISSAVASSSVVRSLSSEGRSKLSPPQSPLKQHTINFICIAHGMHALRFCSALVEGDLKLIDNDCSQTLHSHFHIDRH